MQLTGVIPKLTSSNSCGIPVPFLLKKKKKNLLFMKKIININNSKDIYLTY